MDILTKEMCNFFNKTKLKFLQITIDGTREVHNKTRIHKNGYPTYDKIVENTEMAAALMPNCKVAVRVNIQNDNKDQYHIIYEELSDKWKQYENCVIYPAIVIPQGACSVSCLEPSEKADFYVSLEKEYNQKVNFVPSLKLGSCDAIFENSYIIDPDGFLYKCWADIGIKERVIGHLSSGVDNWEFVSAYMMSSDKFTDGKCLDCSIFPICEGGCNRFRVEHKYHGTSYNVCPTDENGLRKYLEIIYDKQQEKITAI
jgi:uncharacterized protein